MKIKEKKLNKKTIVKYIFIGLLLGSAIATGYYFIDYQDKLETEIVVGVSKEKVLLADQNEYNLDVVLNSIISNQLVLQDLIISLNERASSTENQINLIKEQENDNNQSE